MRWAGAERPPDLGDAVKSSQNKFLMFISAPGPLFDDIPGLLISWITKEVSRFVSAGLLPRLVAEQLMVRLTEM